jgi:hypothetical protein
MSGEHGGAVGFVNKGVRKRTVFFLPFRYCNAKCFYASCKGLIELRFPLKMK